MTRGTLLETIKKHSRRVQITKHSLPVFAFLIASLIVLWPLFNQEKEKFICIVAGYTNEMHDFISSNPGLKSRFTQTIVFEDYKPQDLTLIFQNLAGTDGVFQDLILIHLNGLLL